MKPIKLLVALLGITLSPLVAADSFSQGEDFHDWTRAELAWNEEYGTYLAVPVLGEDPFQERMVYSNYYTDFVRFGEALRVAYELQRKQAKDDDMVWSDRYTDYVPRRMAESKIPVESETRQFLARIMSGPCPELAQQGGAFQLAAKD